MHCTEVFVIVTADWQPYYFHLLRSYHSTRFGASFGLQQRIFTPVSFRESMLSATPEDILSLRDKVFTLGSVRMSCSSLDFIVHVYMQIR